MNIKPYIIDDAPRFWSFLTVKFHLLVPALYASVVAGWVYIGEEKRQVLMNWAAGLVGLPADVAGALAALVAAVVTSFVTLGLRAYKQTPPSAPNTEPGVRVVDDLSAPTQPMRRRK